MDTFKSKIKHTRRWLASAAGLLVIISGCTLSGIDDENNNTVTEEDLEAASHIVGESLSDDNSGIISSLNDALSKISQHGFIRIPSKGKNIGHSTQNDEDNSGRGHESNLSYSYDPETGTHTLTFKREINRAEFTKSATDTLKYIFTDANGNFIASPGLRSQYERVETIDYKGKRDGFVETPRKYSTFSRQDTFFIDGLSEASNILGMDGVHHSKGTIDTQNDEGTPISRSYKLTVNFLDIQIDKAVVQENQNLEQGVTGMLSWQMHIGKQNGDVKTIRGTIELTGDGTALLRFQNFTRLFQIRLDDGNVHDRKNSFIGNVESVHTERQSFQVRNRTIKITENTEINPEGDFTTLNQVATALEEGTTVVAAGRGHVKGDIFVATQVIFSDRKSDDHQFRFNVPVSEAKPDLQQIIFGRDERKRVILITEDTEIDKNSDLYTVQQVKEALELGYVVFTKGYGRQTDKEGIDMVATNILFDQKFRDFTTNINPEAGTVTLDNGMVIRVTDDTEFADNSDHETLSGVQEALENGQAVITSGDGEETDEEGIDIIATLIRFTEQS